MTTVINTQPAQNSDSNGNSMMTMVFGIILVAMIGFFLVYFGPSLIRQMKPAGTNITVPDKIDVNVNTPQQAQ